MGNEVIVVDTKGFDIHKGGAKRDLSPYIDKLHAKEVAHGAFIFRYRRQLHRERQGIGERVGRCSIGPCRLGPADARPVW